MTSPVILKEEEGRVKGSNQPSAVSHTCTPWHRPDGVQVSATGRPDASIIRPEPFDFAHAAPAHPVRLRRTKRSAGAGGPRGPVRRPSGMLREGETAETGAPPRLLPGAACKASPPGDLLSQSGAWRSPSGVLREGGGGTQGDVG